MQLKCSFCSTPFALSNDQVAEAIEILKKDPHGHYDAHCPKCRRANKLPRKMFAMHPAYRRMLESSEPAREDQPPGNEAGGEVDSKQAKS